MRKFTSCLIGAIISFLTLLLMLSMLRASMVVVSSFDSASDLILGIYNIAVIVALTVIFIRCIIGCVKYRKEPASPRNVSNILLAHTEGFHMSGLPCAGTPSVDVKLFQDSIRFEIRLSRFGANRQIATLDLKKVTSIQMVANIMQTSAVSKNVSTTINGSDYPHDTLAINYTSEGEDKQILISLPALTNAGHFVKQYEKINPSNNQPIEL